MVLNKMLRYYDDEDLDLAISLIFRKTTTIPKKSS